MCDCPDSLVMLCCLLSGTSVAVIDFLRLNPWASLWTSQPRKLSSRLWFSIPANPAPVTLEVFLIRYHFYWDSSNLLEWVGLCFHILLGLAPFFGSERKAYKKVSVNTAGEDLIMWVCQDIYLPPLSTKPNTWSAWTQNVETENNKTLSPFLHGWVLEDLALFNTYIFNFLLSRNKRICANVCAPP